MSWAITLGIVLGLTVLLYDGQVYGWEKDITRWAQDLGYPLWLFRLTAENPTDPMSYIGAAILAGVAIALFATGHRVEALLVALVFPLHVLGNFPKAIVERDRPSDVIDGITGVGGSMSFPSGHVEYAITFYGFLAFLAVITLKNVPMKVVVLGIWITFVVLCSVGRIAYGRHWPLDVFAAYATGIGLLSGLIWLWYSFRPDGTEAASRGQEAENTPADTPAGRLHRLHGRDNLS